MGQALLQAAGSQNLKVEGRVDQGDDLSGLSGSEVVLDFSFHEATLPLLRWAVEQGTPVVIGTTGHTESESREIMDIGKRLPIVWAGNYSVGVNVLLHIARLTAQKLGAGFDPEIVEAHHRMKVDAPSGTAQNLVDAVLGGLGWGRESVIYGRQGITGQRPEKQLAVHAVRGGGIIGEHTVFFSSSAERLELTHRAADRAIFADGAIRAAVWILQHPSPGVYSMQDVLGLRKD